MDTIRELLLLVPATAEVIRTSPMPSPWTIVLVGVLLAAIGWVSTHFFARLLNRQYGLRVGHHILCGFAAVVTLTVVPSWAVTSYLRGTLEAVDRLWQKRLAADADWQQETYARAYAAVQRLGVEDFARAPAPGQTDSHIPLTKPISVQTVSVIYASGAVAHFGGQFPKLRTLVRDGAEDAALRTKLRSAFQQRNVVYPIEQASRFAAASIGGGVLDLALSRMRNAQLIMLVLVLAAQTLAFGATGVAAYRDIKVHA